MLMESFYRTHTYLVEHTEVSVRRRLMDEVDWQHRLIGIKGSRGVGKTTFLLQYAKEHYGENDRKCLYINMNNFYFQGRGIADFATEFVAQGGRVLLIDQVFKQPNWSQELRRCHDQLPQLRIVFTGSSVMRLKEENPELNGIVESYNLRGFSFREYLAQSTGCQLPIYTLDEVVRNHTSIAKQVLTQIKATSFFEEYLQKGYYPFYMEHRSFAENLLKTMNMMTEVDILLIKQIELKYLTKIKKLFYLLAVNGPHAPNISQLAQQIDTSRATVMNYIKYLADARLINLIYNPGQDFPKKPARVMLHNPNLIFAIYPMQIHTQDVMETFFVNTLWKDHTLNLGTKGNYLVDGQLRFRVCDAETDPRPRRHPDTLYAQYHCDVGEGNQIPLWLLGLLY